MAVGDIHVYHPSGYWFRETLNGPMVRDVCADCGAEVYRSQDYAGTTPFRCSTCGRKHYGLPPF